MRLRENRRRRCSRETISRINPIPRLLDLVPLIRLQAVGTQLSQVKKSISNLIKQNSNFALVLMETEILQEIIIFFFFL